VHFLIPKRTPHILTVTAEPENGTLGPEWARGPVTLIYAAFLAFIFCLSGCGGRNLGSARSDFYSGRLEQAEKVLQEENPDSTDMVLVLMERGTVKQALGKFQESSADLIKASELADMLETYSVGRGAASMMVNDTVQSFRGAPFERTYLHDLTALNHLAQGRWEDAAVESRRIIQSLERHTADDYPDDAFSRYVAGFGLEMAGDYSNAQVQYRLAGEIAGNVFIDEHTGFLALKPQNTPEQTESHGNSTEKDPEAYISSANSTVHGGGHLVCFLLLGRSPTGEQAWNSSVPSTPYSPRAEIFHRGTRLGGSYVLSDTYLLAVTTARKQALKRLAKTAARIAAKESVARAVDDMAQGWGDLVRIILIGMLEKPDFRRWETLPRYMAVARVPCPEDLQDFDLVIRNGKIGRSHKFHITSPISRRGRVFFSFFRSYPPGPVHHSQPESE